MAILGAVEQRSITAPGVTQRQAGTVSGVLSVPVATRRLFPSTSLFPSLTLYPSCALAGSVTIISNVVLGHVS